MYEIRVLLRDLNANAGAEGIVMERTTWLLVSLKY
jgi:hypothetical protein